MLLTIKALTVLLAANEGLMLAKQALLLTMAAVVGCP